MERQKEANCPCTIHTQKRGFDWIVFNQLPDRIPSKDDGYQGTDSDESTGFSDTESKDENEEARVSDPISNHEGMEKVNNQKNENASGASSENLTSADLTARYNAIFNPSVSNSSVNYPSTPGMRQNIPDVRRFPDQQNKERTRKLTTTELKVIPEDMLEESRQRIDSNIPCKFDQIVYMDNVKGITYSFRYFNAYKFDWRVVMNYQNEEPMLCTYLEVGSIMKNAMVPS